ncbi:hypothetical protein JCM3775_001752 [Rhodotorula graminis]
MIAHPVYPSFDGTTHQQWQMVAPPQQQQQQQQLYYGAAHYDPLHAQHQASLHQHAAQAQAHAYPAYNVHAYAHGQQQAQQFYPPSQPHQQLDPYYAQQPAAFAVAQHMPVAAVEQARSRFAFATPTHAPAAAAAHFTLPPPAQYAAAHYGVQQQQQSVQQHHQDEAIRATWESRRAESASRATLDSEHLGYLLDRLAQSADSRGVPSADEYDHPSHSRPPHRADAMHDEPVTAFQQQHHTTYDLIPNVSSVPPPPPVELSAVPLADLATEMVWEAVRRGYLHGLESAVPSAPAAVGVIGQPARNGPRRSHGAAEQFGIIGDRRSAMALETFADAAARRQRLADLGFPGQARAAAAAAAFPVEPSSAFRAFVKQILTATLVAPEDIVLALYYVSRMPLDQIIPSTPAERGQDAQTTSFKAAPFKIVLGALMLANKQLQDNSYRNETFATVSGIPLVDVNALEAHVFKALSFDVALREDKWLAWLGAVVEYYRSSRGVVGERLAVQEALARLVVAAQRSVEAPSVQVVTGESPLVAAAASLPSSASSSSLESLASVATAASSMDECPSTPHRSAQQSSYLEHVNLDASGPLESPLHFDARRRQLLTRAASSLASSVAASQLDSPLVARRQYGNKAVGTSSAAAAAGASVTELSGYSLFPPVDLANTRSRSFGHETWSRAIC